MRITKLTLENIKSYQQADIDLTPGVNAICGMNGAGKTTILEAIGFTLFDYLPYKHEHFLREGERSGTVRVQLETRDGGTYEVVRRIGAGNPYYVHDFETGAKIAERGPSVIDWVRTKALDLDYEADLEALFQNAVGVPQGRMTADFQASAGPRKKTFDPLLRVEEYRDAYENLRETMSWLRDQRANVDQEIARLETDTARLPEVRDQIRDHATQLRESEEILARLAANLLDVESKLSVFEEMERTVRALDEEVRGTEYDVHRHEDKLRMDEELLQSARLARDTVETNGVGYRTFVAAREALRGLETQRVERDKLNADLSNVKAILHRITGTIEELDTQRRSAIEALHQAAALDGDVAQQESLEAQLGEMRAALAGLPDLQFRVQKASAEAERLRQAATEVEEKMRQAAEAQVESTRLPEIAEQLAAVTGRLGEVRSIQQQRAEVEAEGKRRRQQLDAETKNVEELRKLRAEMGRLVPLGAGLETLTDRHTSLREDQLRLAATIDYQAVAQASLQREHCPLLDLRCPVVTADGSVIDGFDQRMAGLREQLQTVEEELSAVTPALEAAGKAAEDLRGLQVQAARLEGSEKAADDLASEVERYRRQYVELTKALEEQPSLEERRSRLGAEEARAREAAGLAAQLPLLQQQQKTEGERLADYERELAAMRAQEEALQGVRAQAESLTEQLERLNDPRGRRNGLARLGAEQGAIEARITHEQEHLAVESHRLKALVGRLQSFAALDDDIARHRAAETENESAYNAYIAAEPESAQLEQRTQVVEATRALLEAARQAETQARRRLDDMKARYDAEEHARRKEEHRDLRDRLAAENERRQFLEKRLHECETEGARLEHLESRLRQQRDEADELERATSAVSFIRDTIKMAGPAVTERILANISQTASDIYAEIMDDHTAELRWDRDYEILVQRGAETRSFPQLSGGEQMSAALAVRLALLKELSEVDVAFFDEPTQNMDVDRRNNLAAQIGRVKGFEQLIVISHDDTFEHHTDNLIRLTKVDEETRVETA